MSHSKEEKKKEISSKMYSQHRCGKCNRFGHHHDKCTKGQGYAMALDKFVKDNKDTANRSKYLSERSFSVKPEVKKHHDDLLKYETN